MVKSGIALPKLAKKHLSTKTTTDTRTKNDAAKERRGKSRSETLSSLFPNLLTKTKGIMDIEKRTPGPLMEWQLQRAGYDFPSISLRQHKALVTEWLRKNHFRVKSTLPRLDPLILTSRGADFSKFINFIYPAPFSLKKKSNSTNKKRRMYGCEEKIKKLRTPCPRLQRSKRNESDIFTLNPVIRVGGGYKRLTWNTWEVLPAIGQGPEDFTSVLNCSRCGAKLVLHVTHKATNSTGPKRLVITYPSNCSNCGKQVNSPRNQVQGNIEHQHVAHEELENQLREYHQLRENQEPCYDTSTRLENPLRTRSLDDQRVCRNHTGLSITHNGRDDSFFMTEADERIKQINRSLCREEKDVSSNNSKSPNGTEVIEHRDHETGIKVRGRRKGGREINIKEDSYNVSEQEEMFSGERVMELEKREISRKDLVITQANLDFLSDEVSDKISDEFEEKDMSHPFPTRQSKAQQSFRKKISSSRLSSCSMLIIRNAMSDSELLIPERYWNFLKRVSARKRQDNRYQSLANKSKDVTGPKGESSRTGTSLLQANRTSHSCSLVEMRNRAIHQDPGNLDGYMADNEEDSLLKLQARLLQLRLDARRKSSIKEKRSREKISKSRMTRCGSSREKNRTGLIKKMPSLSMYSLDSDSWDSDENLNFEPISDDYYSTDSEGSPFPRLTRATPLGKSGLTSNKNNLIYFYDERGRESTEELKNSAENSDEEDNDQEDDDDTCVQKEGKRKKYRFSLKTMQINKPRKAVPTLSIVPHQSKVSASKWNKDDLNEDDIKLLTAQMKMSFKPKENTDLTKIDVRYCNGQYCYRCGSFVDQCEATCNACGTYCKRPDAPCNICRDICERCGKPKIRCVSVVEGLGILEEEDLQVKGLSSEDTAEFNHLKENDGNVSSTVPTETSFDTKRTDESSSKTRRKLIIKKQRKSGSRCSKRVSRQIPPTKDGMQTPVSAIDHQPLDFQNLQEDKMNDEEPSQDIQGVQDSDLQVAKPEPSNYNTSNKISKPSKTVIAQKVIYKNNSSLSQGSSMDQSNIGDQADIEETEEKDDSGDEEEDEIDDSGDEEEDDIDDSGDEEEDDIDDSGDEEEHEIQAPRELSIKEDQKDEVPPQNENSEIVESKKKVETPKEEEIPKEVDIPKLKSQIPKPKLRGVQRVNAAYRERVELNKRLQAILKDALQNVVADADIKVRRDSAIDYLAQYRLVDRSKIELYGRAFALEDEKERGILNHEQMLLALEGIPSMQGMSRQQLNYALQVLEIDSFSRVSFKMFAVITALCERVTTLDSFVKELVEGLDLTQTEWKLDMYKDMFYVAGNRSVSFISPDDLRIELKAGGLNQVQEDHVIMHITQSSDSGQISFLDYMAYLPLFLSIHQNICSNALDMSRDKYSSDKLKTMVCRNARHVT